MASVLGLLIFYNCFCPRVVRIFITASVLGFFILFCPRVVHIFIVSSVLGLSIPGRADSTREADDADSSSAQHQGLSSCHILTKTSKSQNIHLNTVRKFCKILVLLAFSTYPTWKLLFHAARH